MSDIARAVLVGRLTRDPQLNDSGKVLTIGVAAGRSEKQQDGSYEDVASFFDVKVLGNRASALAGILGKGHRIAIDGQLVQERWQDKTTGDNRSRVVILANEVVLLQPRPSDNGTTVAMDVPVDGEYATTAATTDDSIPF